MTVHSWKELKDRTLNTPGKQAEHERLVAEYKLLIEQHRKEEDKSDDS